ncbi:hypothetical protein [Allokutzneria sp. NRRL B-24872]|uniref:hypothetical protein n=1 Tax=Allokutzneria sp. NRRL B-24872 TaxID=1137961 RepID=UPI000A3A0BDF|nr:hypothetical protein [Allokutzneria sp. NRRL B-24872]
MNATQIMACLGVLLVLVLVWRAGARRAKAGAKRSGVRLLSLAGRVSFNAALIVAVQWTVITYGGNGWLLLAVLAVPALFAAYSVTKALTVTAYEVPRRRGERR